MPTVIISSKHPGNPKLNHLSAVAFQHKNSTRATSGVYSTAKVTSRPKHCSRQKLVSCDPAIPAPPTNQHKSKKYISLRRDTYPPMCQMNILFVRQQSINKVFRDNPENPAERWPQPQNKHLSKQTDRVFEIYKYINKQLMIHSWNKRIKSKHWYKKTVESQQT